MDLNSLQLARRLKRQQERVCRPWPDLIEEFNDYFDTSFSDDEVDTVGGLVMHAFGLSTEKRRSRHLGWFTFKVVHA